MGISDSPRQLVNQLRRASAPAFAKSRLNTPLEAAIACHGGARAPCSNDHIEYSATVYTLYKEPVAYQTAPATTATSCNQLVPVPCLTDERKSRFRCRGRRTKNDRVFGERRVYRARMAASNKLRVTPSHLLQPTTGLHQWYVHISTYGRAVASKPAGFGSYERPRPPWCMRESSALRWQMRCGSG